jgi:homoserine kinase type II
MSVFTTVTPGELRVWLAKYSLGSLTDLQGITAGIENTNYFVTTSQGRYVLHSLREAEGRRAAVLPQPDGPPGGARHSLPASDREPDERLSRRIEWKARGAGEFSPGKDLAHVGVAHCGRVGALLAGVHLAGQSYGATIQNPRGPRWWTAVMPEILPFLAADDAALLREEVRFQANHRLPDLPRGPIHADLFRDNVLFQGDAVSGIIDFYFACTDALLYDVAITVNDWCVDDDGALDASRTQALLDAYRSTRPFAPGEHDAWPVMLRAGALRFWVSRLYDFHLPRPGELTHAKDPDHFRRILKQHIARAGELPQLAGQ